MREFSQCLIYNDDVLDYTRFLHIHTSIYQDKLTGFRKSRNQIKENLKEVISNYKNSNLKDAIINKVEVSFKCDEYYLLNRRFLDFFLQYINNR